MNRYIYRDILNYIYFDKKSYYLAVLMKALLNEAQTNNEIGTISIKYFKNDDLKPHIIIKPNIIGWKNIEIRIIPTVS